MTKKRRHRGSKKPKPAAHLPVIRTHVAGIDLGSREHWVCGPALADGTANVEVFGTTTPQLEKLADWLVSQQIESVAMESTGVYWIPVYEILESRGLEVLLVNARQLKQVPGRKTDMQDCQWIQLLHSCGLLRGSFRPNESICRLRALQRQMAELVAERTKAIQWMQKALDQMNVQIHHAVADITGKTGMSILHAIVAGERNPTKLAQLRDHRCKKSEAQIAEHLTGNWRKEHLFNLEKSLMIYEQFQSMIDAYEQQIKAVMEELTPPERKDEPPPTHPNRTKAKAIIRRGEEQTRTTLSRFAGVDLTRIDGICVKGTQTILAEIGTDLSAFPDERHFISWLHAAPPNAFSAGKRLKKKKNGTGANRIAGVLRLAAVSLARTKTALGACFRRKAITKGNKVAIFATARKLAQYIFRMLRYGQDYVDEGAEAYEQRYRERRLAALKESARQVGYHLIPQEAEQQA